MNSDIPVEQAEVSSQVLPGVLSARSEKASSIADSIILRAPILSVLFLTAAVIESFRLSSLTSLSSADIWWHLRTGLWIAQNHGLPHHGIYSQSSQLPWMATSWAYDLLLALAYKLLGLRALPALLMGFKACLAVVTFVLAGGVRGRFWLAAILSGLTQYILAATPATPAFCSVLFFGAELLVIFNYLRNRNDGLLWYLPPLMLMWANVAPEFVCGIALLLFFLIARAIEKRGQFPELRAPLFVGGLSLLATFLTPYVYGAWAAFFSNAGNAANQYFPDHMAMKFHQPQDYLLLLVTMIAFLALGMKRSRDPFQVALLVGCAALAFHSQRDVWLVALASIAILGEALREDEIAPTRPTSPRRWRAVTIVAASLLIVAFEMGVPHHRETLLAKVAESYPVAAADYIRQNNLPEPLFNSYEWGGFLMWYQSEIPVAIDGRINLYPDSFFVTYSKVLNAELPYAAFPAMYQARTILLPSHTITAEALSSVPAFKLVYRDDVATVLMPTQGR